MLQIVLQPASNPVAQRYVQKMVENSVLLTRICRYVSLAKRNALREICREDQPTYGAWYLDVRTARNDEMRPPGA